MKTITNETVKQEIDKLSHEQLIDVVNFISSLKYRQRYSSTNFDLEELAKLSNDLAKEDRELAEAGMSDYLNMLNQTENI